MQPAFPYQLAGSEWLRNTACGILGDPPGMGKTRQVLEALPFDDRRVLVVCPPAAINVWFRERDKWKPGLRDYEFGVISWTKLGSDVPLGPPGTYTHLVIDEHHLFKNPKAARTRMLRGLVNRLKYRNKSLRVWALTGTPQITSPADLWGELWAIDHPLIAERWPTLDEFARDTGGVQTTFRTPDGKLRARWEWYMPPALDQATYDRFLLRRDRSLLNLPPVTELQLLVKPDRKAQAELDRFFDLHAPAIGEQSLADYLEKLLHDPAQRTMLSDQTTGCAVLRLKAALAEASRYVEEGEPVVVMSPSQAAVENTRLGKVWVRMSGKTKLADRDARIDAFQNGKHDGMLATIGVAGVAVTLTRAALMYRAGYDWSPDLNDQVRDRIWRIGQNRPCIVTDIILDHPVDKAFALVLNRKKITRLK